jgi:uncharacterized membrane protein
VGPRYRDDRQGWQTRGNWTVPATTLTAVSATPNAGAGFGRTFSFLYSDASGVASIASTEMLFNTSAVYAAGCAAHYDRASNAVSLRDDAGTSWLGPMTLGSVGTLTNNQCTIDVGASSATGAGTNLTVNLAITFKAAFKGAKTIYMEAHDTGATDTAWLSRGAWTVPATTLAVVSSSPGSGTGFTQMFNFLYSDANGFASIATTEQVINGSLSYANGCVTHIDVATNRLYLRNDAGTAWQPAIILGTANVVENSQCSIDVGNSSTAGLNTNLTVTLAITFKPAFTGAKTIYMEAHDTGTTDSGWQTRGTWTVP